MLHIRRVSDLADILAAIGFEVTSKGNPDEYSVNVGITTISIENDRNTLCNVRDIDGNLIFNGCLEEALDFCIDVALGLDGVNVKSGS